MMWAVLCAWLAFNVAFVAVRLFRQSFDEHDDGRASPAQWQMTGPI